MICSHRVAHARTNRSVRDLAQGFLGFQCQVGDEYDIADDDALVIKAVLGTTLFVLCAVCVAISSLPSIEVVCLILLVGATLATLLIYNF